MAARRSSAIFLSSGSRVLLGHLLQGGELLEVGGEDAQAGAGALPLAALRGGVPGLQVLGDRLGPVAQPAVGVAEGERHLGDLRGLGEVGEEALQERGLVDAVAEHLDGARIDVLALGLEVRDLPLQRRGEVAVGVDAADLAELLAVEAEDGAVVARQQGARELLVALPVELLEAQAVDDLPLRPGGDDGRLDVGGDALVRPSCRDRGSGPGSWSASSGCACGSRPRSAWAGPSRSPCGPRRRAAARPRRGGSASSRTP